MDNANITERKLDGLPKEIVDRYLDINDGVSDLIAKLGMDIYDPMSLNRLSKELRPKIIGLIGLCYTNQKFYLEIETSYKIYASMRIGSVRQSKFNAETTAEFWEILKKSMIRHDVIKLQD